jgi:hypothetical protein
MLSHPFDKSVEWMGTQILWTGIFTADSSTPLTPFSRNDRVRRLTGYSK